MRRILLWGGGLVLLALAAGPFALAAGTTALAERIETESGVTPVLAAPGGLGFDPRIEGTAPEGWQALLALSGIRRAARAYPPGILASDAPNVLLAGRLEILGHRVGGTVQPGWVLLATDYLGPGTGPRALARVYHHEVSSLLIARHPFPYGEWRAALPDGFAFPESDAETLAATRTRADDPDAFLADGFVSDYGTSSLENDINTYAELLLSDPDRLAALAAAHPAVARKEALIRTFYESLHPDFARRPGDDAE